MQVSLIEKALGKLRVSGAAAIAERVIEAPAPAFKREVAEPQLRVSGDMLQKLGLAAPAEQEHQRTSEYRQIKRKVVAEILDNPAERVVLVASALAGEGKSFTAANLARSLALEPDFSVLLVDADVINPQLTRSFGLQGSRGLTDALADGAIHPESLVVTTDIKGLSVLPAGAPHEHATEFFASERMRAVLKLLLSVPQRILVIDSLPLLVTTEARSLVPHASQLLLVVRAESTPQSAVQQALTVIGEDANVKLVLNAVVRTTASRYLGYGYGFDYNYAPKESKEPDQS
jgi:protein-tyrosine kinase